MAPKFGFLGLLLAVGAFFGFTDAEVPMNLYDLFSPSYYAASVVDLIVDACEAMTGVALPNSPLSSSLVLVSQCVGLIFNPVADYQLVTFCCRLLFDFELVFLVYRIARSFFI